MPIRLARSTKFLLIFSFIAFLIQQTGDQFLGTHLMSWFALIPAKVFQDHHYWQVFTYSFMHRDVMHMFFDLLMLAFIGSELEFAWGRTRFLRYLFFCSTASALIYLLLQTFLPPGAAFVPMLGASGAIYGLLLAYGLIFGERVLLFMLLFPMKAKYFVWILAAVELLTTVYSSGGTWASLAHIGGMVCGLGYLWSLVYWKRIWNAGRSRLSFSSLRRKKKNRSKHLRLVINNDGEFESGDEKQEKPRTWH